MYSANGNPRLKRPHRKSRAGCMMCKQRRLKCDEGIPRCDRCIWRGFDCCYQAGTEPKAANQLAKGADSGAIEGALPSTGIDVKLVQHYLSHTSDTFARMVHKEPEQAAVWQHVLPAIAFRIKAASHALMALSAFCMASHSDEDNGGSTPDYITIADTHYTQSLVLARPLLTALDASTAGDVLATVMLLTACAMAKMSGQGEPSAAYGWLHHVRSFRVVHQALPSLPLDCFGPMAALLRPAIPLNPLEWIRLNKADIAASTDLFRAIRTTRCTATRRIRAVIDAHVPPYDDSAKLAYQQALSQLMRSRSYFLDHKAWDRFRAIFSWPSELPPYFVTLFTDGDEMTKVIYAYWLVGTLLVRNRWWIGDMGAEGIRKIALSVESSKEDFDSLLEWPLQMVQQSLIDQEAGLFALGSLDV